MEWDDINRQFGRLVRRYREARGYSQEAFAARCGISRAYYGRIERGEHSVTLETCQKIAEALAQPLSALFEDLV